MLVRHLSLKDFRNYPQGEFVFNPGLNALIGRNGQGKTNVVEALMFLATLRSHRTAQDHAMIRASHDAAVIRCRLSQGDREALLEMQLNRSSPNKALINRHAVRSRELGQMISAVLFAPEDLSIVRGEPSIRRRFLDDGLISRHPVAAGAIADYDRVLRQRNTLLRDAKHAGKSDGLESLLNVWDEQLIGLGSQIIAHRRMLVRDLMQPLVDSYRSLVDEDHRVSLHLAESLGDYLDVSRETSDTQTVHLDVSRETIAQDFRLALTQARAKEIERGVTLVGPHRDDVVFTLKELPVKGYASHGETWSYALSLKLALAEVLKADSTIGDPIIILDDVFAELDVLRRVQLFNAVKQFEQVIVTAAVEEDIPERSSWRTIRIHAGEIVSEEPPERDEATGV